MEIRRGMFCRRRCRPLYNPDALDQLVFPHLVCFKDLQLYLPIIDNKVLLLHQLREILASSIELFKEDPHFQIANKYSYNQWRIYKLILLS